jgi:hypothetical protein
LTIVDRNSHFALWSLTEPVQGAFRKATWLKNFDQSLGNLMDDLKKLAGPSPSRAGQPEGSSTNDGAATGGAILFLANKNAYW